MIRGGRVRFQSSRLDNLKPRLFLVGGKSALVQIWTSSSCVTHFDRLTVVFTLSEFRELFLRDAGTPPTGLSHLVDKSWIDSKALAYWPNGNERQGFFRMISGGGGLI